LLCYVTINQYIDFRIDERKVEIVSSYTHLGHMIYISVDDSLYNYFNASTGPQWSS